MKENDWIEKNCDIKCEWKKGQDLWIIEIHDCSARPYDKLIAPAIIYCNDFKDLNKAYREAVRTFKQNIRTDFRLSKYVDEDSDTEVPNDLKIEFIMDDEYYDVEFEQDFSCGHPEESLKEGSKQPEEAWWPNTLDE